MNRLRGPQILLLLTASLLLAATFLQPTMQLKRPGYRYVFVFDISQSMNVKDIPDTSASINRLDYAKQVSTEAISELPCGTKVGLAIFTGYRPFLLIKPVETCANQQELSRIISNINWLMTWKTKSEIAKGLYKSIRLMKALQGKTRLVFLTDGHEAPPINPDLQPRFPGQKGEVSGLIVGVGGLKPVPIPKFDKKGEQQGYWKADEVKHVDVYTQERNEISGSKLPAGTEHLSSLRESYLKSLADRTGLSYYRLADAGEFSNKLKIKLLSNQKVITTDIRWLLALLSLLLFVATLLIKPWQKRWNRDKGCNYPAENSNDRFKN